MPQLTELELLEHIDPSQLDYQEWCSVGMCLKSSYCVYKHTAPNGKVYIGITGINPIKRWDSGYGYRKQAHFWNAIQKYGWKNIKHEIICKGLSKKAACELEVQLIEKHKSSDNQYGYNLSTGGKGGSTGTILSQETKLKMSKSRTGTKHHMYGKNHTNKTRKILSEKLSGKNHPQYGTHRSEKTKEKLRKANSGIKHPMFGTHHTDEHKKKISLASPLQKPVICLETGIIYRSAAEASRQCGISHISDCCRNAPKRKTAGGYHWAYAEGQNYG